MSKTFIISDVHGCYDELVELLDKINLNKQTDTVIFVGDYFDRGPKSYEVWKCLCGLKESMGERCVLIRGNHEVMLVDYLNGWDDTWKINGYQPTIKSFVEHDIALSHIKDWVLNNTSLYYKTPLFDVAHASRKEENIEDEDEDTLIWDRSLYSQRQYGGKLTFVGHTPLMESPIYLSLDNPESLTYTSTYELPEVGVIDIDTACVYGGKLTAAEIDESKNLKFTFVDSKQEKKF